jgi:hypothetical protein
MTRGRQGVRARCSRRSKGVGPRRNATHSVQAPLATSVPVALHAVLRACPTSNSVNGMRIRLAGLQQQQQQQQGSSGRRRWQGRAGPPGANGGAVNWGGSRRAQLTLE